MTGRYMLFAGDNYYPCGGMKDFHSSHDTVDEAKAAGKVSLDGHCADWAHIYDTATGEQIEIESSVWDD